MKEKGPEKGERERREARDSGVIFFHIYASWFSPPSFRYVRL